MLVVAKLLLYFELVPVIEVELQLTVLLPPGLELVALVSAEGLQLQAFLLLGL